MKCLIPGLNVKILGRAIHAMAKIGDDLYIEGLPEGLVLRTINSSDSAYCKILFAKAFFTYYNNDYFKVDGDNECLKCKISMKSAMMVFKSPSHMDKQVEMCEIKLDTDGSKLIFQLRCRHGITKTHFLSILESKKMDVTYDKKASPNKLLAQHKLFSEAVSNFQISEDQLTIDVSPQLFILKNYANSNVDTSKTTRTQLTLKPIEFDSYQIQVESSVTFSMKEFRAVLMFAEAVNLPIYTHLETSGKPAMFEVNNNVTFEADFVIATERADGVTQSTNSTVVGDCKNTSKRKYSNGAVGVAAKRSYIENDVNVQKILDEDSQLFNFIDMPGDQDIVMEPDPPNAKQTNQMDEFDDFPSSPILNTQTRKVRTIFKRCFDATFHPSDANGAQRVLVDESDDE